MITDFSLRTNKEFMIVYEFKKIFFTKKNCLTKLPYHEVFPPENRPVQEMK